MNILLTGASRGIGAATFDLLTTSGHRVAGHSTRGGNGLIAGDLADPASPRKIWKAALDQLDGRIDALVNNAGIYEGVEADSADAEWHSAWGRTMQVNLQAAADLCRLAVGHFRANGAGRIVNVASRAAFRGDSPSHWHYSASKAGMIGMTKTIARGYAAENAHDRADHQQLDERVALVLEQSAFPIAKQNEHASHPGQEARPFCQG